MSQKQLWNQAGNQKTLTDIVFLPATCKCEAIGPLLMGLREGLRGRELGRMRVGKRGREVYDTPSGCNHPFPPYQLIPDECELAQKHK